MTKCFYYTANTKRLEKEFCSFFESHPDIKLSSWLRWTFELIVADEHIHNISCSVHSNKANFWICFANRKEHSAGETKVLCETDLLNGFLERIENPEKWINN